jgi:hypothetical protein
VTRTDVVAIIAMVVILVALGGFLLSRNATGNRQKQSHALIDRRTVNCVNNLKQNALAIKIWAGDNRDKYPARVSVENGGVMELAAAGNVGAVFLVLSNELDTPRTLICPMDNKHKGSGKFSPGFGNENVSYFLGLDADNEHPGAILSGDDNFEFDGEPMKSGVTLLTSSASLIWTTERHNLHGNIGLADGSVYQTDNTGLRQKIRFQYGGDDGFTNQFRFAIP